MIDLCEIRECVAKGSLKTCALWAYWLIPLVVPLIVVKPSPVHNSYLTYTSLSTVSKPLAIEPLTRYLNEELSVEDCTVMRLPWSTFGFSRSFLVPRWFCRIVSVYNCHFSNSWWNDFHSNPTLPFGTLSSRVSISALLNLTMDKITLSNSLYSNVSTFSRLTLANSSYKFLLCLINSSCSII